MSPMQRYGLACTALAIFTATQARSDENLLTAEMVVDLLQVGSVALSPDGSRIAYTLTVPRDADDEPGSSYSQLWLADTDGDAPRRFTSGKESVGSPAFSPDGKLITFTVEREKDQEGSQIYAIPADGGEARTLTTHDGSVSGYRWSPDGQWIAFSANDADSEEVKKEKEAGNDWQVLDQDLKFRTLWLLNVDSGETHRVFDAELDVNQIRWAADSQSLVFQANTTARIDDEYLQTGIYLSATRRRASDSHRH